MKILVLCYEYPPIGGGGGRVAQSIATELARRGHAVRVQTAALGWRSHRERRDGVEIFRTASGRRAPDTCRVSEMAAYCATSFWPTLRHLRSWKPDVMHAHFAVPTGVLAWAVSHLTGVPYVLTAHLGDVPGGVPEQTDFLFKVAGPLARQVWRHAASATAVSSFVQELAERAYKRPVERILNGIDLTDAGAPDHLPQARRPTRLVFAGRFNAQKNVLLLLDALALLNDAEWELTLIGDGPERAKIEARIAQHRLQGRVRLTGWLDAPEVVRILAAAEILCLPSLAEGLPVAAIEALKHGLAILGSDIPGLRDVLENGANGFSVPSGDSSAFAARLRTLLDDPSRLFAMRRASAEKARAFDLQLAADQYERALERAADGGLPR